MSRNERHVTHDPNGGWNVVKPNAGHASGHFDSQADAIARAREIVHNTGGGELVIHGTDGRIRDFGHRCPGQRPEPAAGYPLAVAAEPSR